MNWKLGRPILLIWMPILLLAQGERGPFDDLKGIFEAREAELLVPVESLQNHYDERLTKLVDKTYDSGDLSQVRELEAEQKTFRQNFQEKVTKNLDLASARQVYRIRMEQILSELVPKKRTLLDAYSKQLEKRKKELVRDAKLKMADPVEEEFQRVSRLLRFNDKQLAATVPSGLPQALDLEPLTRAAPPGVLAASGDLLVNGLPEKVARPDPLRGKRVVAMDAHHHGAGGWIAVTSAGQVFTHDMEKCKPPLGLKTAVSVSVGSRHAVLHRDGTVTFFPFQPKLKRPLRNVVQIAQGGGIGLALHRDGTVSYWGSMYEDNPDAVKPRPAWLTGAKAVAAGVARGYIVTQEGNVWGWSDQVVYTELERLKGVERIDALHKGIHCIDGDGNLFRHSDHNRDIIQVKLPKGLKARSIRSGHGAAIFQDQFNVWHHLFGGEKWDFPSLVEEHSQAKNMEIAVDGAKGLGVLLWTK